MILKRLLAAALGALGLGAFAALPASAQEIPAPNLFDGQVSCVANLPTPPATLVGQDKDKMDIGITAKIASKMSIALTMGVPSGDDAGLANILYMIDAGNGNCGAGAWTEAEISNGMDAAGLVPPTGAMAGDAKKPLADAGAADVGAGYTATLAEFDKVVAQEAVVKTKEDALQALYDDDVDDSSQVNTIASAKKELEDEQAKLATATAKLTAAGAGPINMAGIVEWRAKNAVSTAVTAWNDALSDISNGDNTGTLDVLNPTNYTKYNDLHNSSGQLLGLFDTDGNANLANIRTYANADGSNASTQDSMTGAVTGASAFDAAGNLLIPKTLVDDELVPTTADQTYQQVKTRLDDVVAEVKLLVKLQEDNKNALLQPVIDEAVRRGKLEQEHYQGQYNNLVADNTDVDTGTDGVQSLKTRYAAHTKAVTTRDNAGVALETAVQARENATDAVVSAFSGPQDFYQQLVDRRSYLNDLDTAELTRLQGLTGDKAATAKQLEDAQKAIDASQKALDNAKATQASFQGLVADDSPVKDLVLETLKPNTGKNQGDDGGVLVDTISGAYAVADSAKESADAAVAAVEGLTGDDGQVSQNAAAIEVNAANIATNTAAIFDEDGKSRILTNAENIATNAENIMTNTAAIFDADGNSRIMANQERLDAHEVLVMKNIDDIASNTQLIGANTGAIAANASRIDANVTAIRELREDMSGGIAAAMALAGMPEIGDRGVSVGAGSYDGESAVAVGVHFSGENSRFKAAITSGGGETGVSIGGGWSF